MNYGELIERRVEEALTDMLVEQRQRYQTGPAESRSASRELVVGGFLTRCRKDFTTQVQMTLRVYLLKLGTVKPRRV